MKEYANKFPKAFDDVRSKILQISNIEWDGICFVCWGYDDNGRYPATEIPECMVRGFLVEKYFPEHGIEIEQLSTPNSEDDICGMYWRVWNNKKKEMSEDFETPEKAISKAFEIREKQLEGK